MTAIRLSRREFMSIAAGAAGLAALSACVPIQAPAPVQPAPAGVEPATAPATKKEIVIALGADPVTLDPRRTEITTAFSLTHPVTEEVVFRDLGGNVIPWLADSWEYQDETTLVLHLQDGLAFENGEPLDAAAVKYTIDTVMDPENVWVAAEKRGWFSAVDSIEAPDATTVILKMKEQNHAVLSYLTLIGVVPSVAAEAAGDGFGWQGSGVRRRVPGGRRVTDSGGRGQDSGDGCRAGDG